MSVATSKIIEDNIQQQQKEDKTPPQPSPEGADFEDTPSPSGNSDGFSQTGDDELSKLAIAKALGFEKTHDLIKYSDQVERLLEYARMMGANDITGIIAKINQLRNLVGMNKTIHNLSVYAYLALEKDRLEKRMKEFYGK